MDMLRAWSAYQETIFAAVENIHRSKQDLVVLARAGTGKTSTMVEAVIRYCRVNRGRRVLTCAFNVKNAKELEQKLAAGGLDWKTATARTLNSVGLATIRKAWGKGVEVDAQKGRDAAKTACRDLPEIARKVVSPTGKVAKLATLAKITLTSSSDLDTLVDLCALYEVTDACAEADALARLASRAMEISAADRSRVDFDDQLWFPSYFNLLPWQHDLVVVDEVQDLNASQLALARNSVRPGGRLVAVGDDRQAIYGWRAADSGFITRMITELNARTLKLPRTYRCGTAIVAEAKRLVPDYEADASNPTGLVRSSTQAKMITSVRPGDFILCRINAPLLSICIELLKAKIPASIQGRDFLGQILIMLERSRCETTRELAEWLSAYEQREHEKLITIDASDEAVQALMDRCACLNALLPEVDTCDELRAMLEGVFSDTDDASRVTLSTAHRAKGLERDRVWLLRDTFRSGDQEDNCLYVAITRARTELVYVR